MPATPCHRHPDASATRSCGECFQPICAGCSVIDGERCRCPECATLHRGRTLRMALRLFLATAVLVLGGGFLAWRSSAETSFDYGPKRSLVAAMRSQLDKEPCDRTRAVQYAQTLFSADDWRGSIQFSDDFVTRCGKFPQLRSISYSAHLRLSEFELAIRDATELIESAPGNASYWVWRAQAHQSRGASELALGDFQEAFRLQPDQFQVVNHLATAYEHLRQPCEAHRVLKEHQRAHSAYRPEVMEWIARLEKQGRCGSSRNWNMRNHKDGMIKL